MGSWLLRLDHLLNRILNRANFLFTGTKAPSKLRPMTQKEALNNAHMMGLRHADEIQQYVHDYTYLPCMVDEHQPLKY